MNNTTPKAVFEAIDTASRHWRDEYDAMTISMVSKRRREHAINLVHKAIALHEVANLLTKREVAELIVDNSELAFMGFDAVNTTPRTAFERKAVAPITRS